MPIQRATILLVEDDPGVARLEQLRLERAGYAVATAASAEEGLDRVAGGGIDLIVLDQTSARGPAAWSSSARSRKPATTCRRSW